MYACMNVALLPLTYAVKFLTSGLGLPNLMCDVVTTHTSAALAMLPLALSVNQIFGDVFPTYLNGLIGNVGAILSTQQLSLNNNALITEASLDMS